MEEWKEYTTIESVTLSITKQHICLQLSSFFFTQKRGKGSEEINSKHQKCLSRKLLAIHNSMRITIVNPRTEHLSTKKLGLMSELEEEERKV